MRLVPQTSPYIRKNVSVKRMMLDVVIALMPVTLFAMIQNGWNGVYVFLTSIITMLLGEIICHGLTHWPKDMKVKELFTKAGFEKVKATYTCNNIIAPLISALIYALIMPAGCDFYVVFVGALFGIIVGKMLFGGLGSNVFNPAGAGRIFVGLCFGTQIGNAYGNFDGYVGATPLAYTKGNLANTGNYGLWNLFLGNIPGCMGEVSALMILIGAVYLFVRRSADLRACLGYLLSFAAVMFIACVSYVGKFGQGDLFRMFAYQMLSGGILFGAVFMITDPVTSPTTKYGRLLFASIAGCITALIRVCGALPEGVVFSIFIANMLAPAIDYLMRGKPNTYTLKQCIVLGVMIVVVCMIASASVMGGWF